MKRKWVLGMLLVPLLTGCLSVQKIARNQELLKEFQAPAGVVLKPGPALTSDDRAVRLAGWTAVVTYRTESPDFWTGVSNELFTKADLKRVVASYEIEGGGDRYRLDIVTDLYRPKSGSGASWLVRKPEVHAGVPDRRVPLEYSHLPGGEVLAKGILEAPYTVKLYYNDIPRSGGWTDVFNSPTALFVDGQDRAYLKVVGLPGLLEVEGLSPATPGTQAALLLGYLLLESEKKTFEEWDRSAR